MDLFALPKWLQGLRGFQEVLGGPKDPGRPGGAQEAPRGARKLQKVPDTDVTVLGWRWVVYGEALEGPRRPQRPREAPEGPGRPREVQGGPRHVPGTRATKNQ